ncbi:replication initiator protein A [Gemella sp. zg-570]|uniref:replication initiator protein A n=1 Tax=Gemella sp. zg-570 TaxID=2840371 RepID=UPI001C0B6EAE|nr:replication initiator protein A [Gemella sp. zg-570]QWQ39271.1 replication initiator protein A [Gemella sp. zg-570]
MNFFQAPKELFNPKSKYFNLSNNAKILYMFMLDRVRLSQTKDKKFYDNKEKKYFIYFNIEDLLNNSGLKSNKTLIKAKQELIEVNLIEQSGNKKNTKYFVFLPQDKIIEKNKIKKKDKSKNKEIKKNNNNNNKKNNKIVSTINKDKDKLKDILKDILEDKEKINKLEDKMPSAVLELEQILIDGDIRGCEKKYILDTIEIYRIKKIKIKSLINFVRFLRKKYKEDKKRTDKRFEKEEVDRIINYTWYNK